MITEYFMSFLQDSISCSNNLRSIGQGFGEIEWTNRVPVQVIASARFAETRRPANKRLFLINRETAKSQAVSDFMSVSARDYDIIPINTYVPIPLLYRSRKDFASIINFFFPGIYGRND